MLLTITSTHPPATDLGYLLHKNPARCQSFELPVGTAHVFYPEASDGRCTVAMLLEIDPVGLVRRQGRTLREYVNDRPYAASSFLSVAISRVFGTAMRGKSKERPELARTPLPLRARISALPCREGEGFIERLDTPRMIEQPCPFYIRSCSLLAQAVRSRNLGTKRSLALREFALGVEALERFVRREPLYRVHECVFGVLALESEPVDPRL